MSAREKSDLPKVAEKRANEVASAAAELVERRGGAKENAELQSTVRTQSRAAVSQAQSRIREAVIRNRRDKLTALLHHLTVDVLRASFFGLKKFAAPGVDEMTWTEYAKGLEENLADLHSRVQTVSTGRGISSLWGAQFSPLGGDGDQPFERSGPPVFGGRPRRLIGAVDD